MDPNKLDALEHEAAALQRHADAADAHYERWAWFKYAAVFVPVPFVVLLFRLQLEPWGYYLAGGAFVGTAVAVMVVDWFHVARRDAAIRAAEQARASCDAARAPGA